MSSKSFRYTCIICERFLKDPVMLPCSDSICGEHVIDGTGSIKCLLCDKEFDVPQNGFTPDTDIAKELAEEYHLNDEHKTIKRAIQDLIQQLENLQTDAGEKERVMRESTSFDNRQDIISQIDIHRDNLKTRIDDIADQFIAQVKAQNNAYNEKLKSVISNVDIEQCRKRVANDFRQPTLQIADALRLQVEHEQILKKMQVQINEFDTLAAELGSIEFRATSTEDEIFCDKASFGQFVSKDVIACTTSSVSSKTIKFWNLTSNQCMSALGGHSDCISCLERIDENRFASGSWDNQVKIWSTHSATLTTDHLKTLATGHQHGVQCLKTLSLNSLASGSYEEIKIWSIDSGECIKALNAHSNWVYDLVCLPNGHLMSCSFDNTIKEWDLKSEIRVQTLTGHAREVNCLLLLKNGELASGSWDSTIKVWDI